jgi:hypothetical protein
VILVSYIWLRLNKNSGKEEKRQKKASKQERKIKAYKHRVEHEKRYLCMRIHGIGNVLLA